MTTVVTEKKKNAKVITVEKEKKETGNFSLNLKVNEKGQIVLPRKNPINNQDLEYVREDGCPVIPMKKQLQKTIDALPVPPQSLWKQACAGDEVTNKSWNKQWNDALSENEKNYNFTDLSCYRHYFNSEKYQPVIIAGSGPSLKNNSKYLKKNVLKQKNLMTGKETETRIGGRENIRLVSCLHNFPYFEDNDLMTEQDFYVNLDAGMITVSEMTEGGKNEKDWYWERTKKRTLVTTVLSCPELLSKWQGNIVFFKTGSSVVRDYAKRVDPSEVPTFSVGGNVLGACLYFAKAILGAGPIVFIGADFCFSYDHKFHAWDSRYDQQFQGVIPVTDIYGNRVFTWPSYYNFKCFFDFVATGGIGNNPQLFINATEGGILGAYPEGNIRHIKQTRLVEVLHTFTMNSQLPFLMSKYETTKQELVLF